MNPEPFWVSVARMCVGVTEIPGVASNPVILQWAKDIRAPAYVNDDTAWCAVFLNRLMLAVHLTMVDASRDPYDVLRARAFERWGQKLATATLGAILVFQRPEGGHVGLYVGEDATRYYVLGGNQGNKVSIVPIDKKRCTGIRWPAGVDLPVDPKPLMVASSGQTSTNEA